MMKILLTINACLCMMLLASIAVAADTSVENAVERKSVLNHCPAFNTTERYRTPVNRVKANPQNWLQLIEKAAAGDEIILKDGIYEYDNQAVVIDKPLTIRGNSKNPAKVIIQGKGYRHDAQGFSVVANDVQIADLTIQNIRHHAISVQETFANTVIYNVRLMDIGTQHIKGNRPGADGLIACSVIGYTDPVSTGDYNSGIDLHGAIGWTIRDNNIFNIFGDGSGCIVDTECGTQPAGGGAAILLWQGSGNNSIERNVITESYRGITLGLNTPYSGGNVSNNFIYRGLTGKQGVNGFIPADAGISLVGADNVLLEGNTVMLAGAYRGAIEVWRATGNIIKNNMISKPIWNRGDASYNDCNPSSAEDCGASGFGNVIVANHAQIELSSAANANKSVQDSAANGLATAPGNEAAVKTAIKSSEHQSFVVLQEGDDSLQHNDPNTSLDIKNERLLMMTERLNLMEERLLLRQAVLEQREAEVTRREEKSK